MSTQLKEEVRQFYETVGWRQIGEGLYQNARYEDLRPVSRKYLSRCHLRVSRHLPIKGKFLLDAGSGPIQYPEYLEYSKSFEYRVCLDISRLGLREARTRLGRRGLYVVGDVARLPFNSGAFKAVVSLHTLHHLPPEEHRLAFDELVRTLCSDGRGIVVYSWGQRSGLMRIARPLIVTVNQLRRLRITVRRKNGGASNLNHSQPEELHAGQMSAQGDRPMAAREEQTGASEDLGVSGSLLAQPGTFTFKHDYRWFRSNLADLPYMDILVWRAVSTQFLRALIHRRLFGEGVLKALFWLEERLPRFMGRHGQYPMIVFRKPIGGQAHEME